MLPDTSWVSLHPVDDHDLALIQRQLALMPPQRLSGIVEA